MLRVSSSQTSQSAVEPSPLISVLLAQDQAKLFIAADLVEVVDVVEVQSAGFVFLRLESNEKVVVRFLPTTALDSGPLGLYFPLTHFKVSFLVMNRSARQRRAVSLKRARAELPRIVTFSAVRQRNFQI
jgi:hypothetical protein